MMLRREASPVSSRRLSRRELLKLGGSVGVASMLAAGLYAPNGWLSLPVARAAPLRLADDRLVAGRDAAFDVLRHLLAQDQGFTIHYAGDRYRNPWIRDSFAWGQAPIHGYPELDPYLGSELAFWLGHQQPSGQWVSDPQSGYWDETAMLIAGVLDAYRITGDRVLVTNNLRRLENGWFWLYSQRREESAAPALIWAELNRRTQTPPVASDWADQIARGNWAGGVNLLWYHATRSLAVLQRVAGRNEQASFLDDYAGTIRRQINAQLWRVGPVVSHRAAPSGNVGHFAGWAPGNDYFETDTNLLAILYGVADDRQSGQILDFMTRNWAHLLGSEYGPPAAKVVYGDYLPDDWATIRTSTSPGAYHMANWINVGALAAMAYHEAGEPERVRSLMAGMANSLAEARGGTGVREWYAFDGTAHGSEQYGWSARGYLVALYRAYLGVDHDWTDPLARNIRLTSAFGGVVGEIVHLGKRVAVETHGPPIGRFSYAVVGGTRVDRPIVPESLIRDGTAIDVHLREI